MWRSAGKVVRRAAYIVVEEPARTTPILRSKGVIQTPAALHLQWEVKEEAGSAAMVCAYLMGIAYCLGESQR